MPKYSRLSIEDREQISRLLASGQGIREIARNLDRNASTISREIGRFCERTVYRAVSGQRLANKMARSRRSGKRKLCINEQLLEEVKAKLADYWSPRQIAQHLKTHYKSSSMHVSAETIYTYIYVFLRREMRAEFTKQLRRGHKKRRVRGKSAKGQTSNLADMVLIDERPAEVDNRLVPGHWEGDLMIGSGNYSAIGTLVERRTRFAILVPLKNKTAEEVRKEFAKEIKRLPKELRLSLTYDQGREMAQHKLFTKETKMKVYFAHPSSPWERGTNENTNGLVRQYFPRGTDFRRVTRSELKKVQRSLNNRPRKTLDWQTPAEAMEKLLR